MSARGIPTSYMKRKRMSSYHVANSEKRQEIRDLKLGLYEAERDMLMTTDKGLQKRYVNESKRIKQRLSELEEEEEEKV